MQILTCLNRFQSTRPVRGATNGGQPSGVLETISIHAPRAGRDVRFFIHRKILLVFQSTRPMRGATYPRQKPI